MSSSFTAGGRTVLPQAIDGYKHSRDARHSFNTVPGAAATNAIAFPASLRNGSMTAVFAELADALTFDSMLAGVDPVLFSDSDVPTLTMTFLLAGRGGVEQSAARGAWIVTFDFQEVTP